MDASFLIILPGTFVSALFARERGIFTTKSITDIVVPIPVIHISVRITQLAFAMSLPSLNKSLITTSISIVNRLLRDSRLSHILFAPDPVAFELLAVDPDLQSVPVAFVFAPLT